MNQTGCFGFLLRPKHLALPQTRKSTWRGASRGFAYKVRIVFGKQTCPCRKFTRKCHRVGPNRYCKKKRKNLGCPRALTRPDARVGENPNRQRRHPLYAASASTAEAPPPSRRPSASTAEAPPPSTALQEATTELHRRPPPKLRRPVPRARIIRGGRRPRGDACGGGRRLLSPAAAFAGGSSRRRQRRSSTRTRLLFCFLFKDPMAFLFSS
jgi:hypothetical protein